MDPETLTDGRGASPEDPPARATSGWPMTLLSLVLFTVASGAIYHVCKDLDVARLVAQLSALSAGQILAALLLTAGSYAIFTGYDWSGLRYIGARIPYRTVALAAFCGCAIANTVGANLVSGGSVRYRIYVPAGLSSLDVARITLFGMAAYGLGNFVIAALAVIAYPELIAGFIGLPATTLHTIGVAGLVAFGAAIAATFLRRAPLRLARLRVQLPTPGLAMTQIALTLTDIVLAGACLYVLVGAPEVPFLGFLVVYTLATVAGMVSHVPGGIGVFEGILLVTFRSLIPTESLAAALLVYRAIYNLLPLAIATVLLMGREVMDRTKPEAAGSR
ncbi:MAG: lysylphosphatidylglycerol synthase domain-containing protein [Gammaproteobacteria bacterium]